jgi:hypothetical protein
MVPHDKGVGEGVMPKPEYPGADNAVSVGATKLGYCAHALLHGKITINPKQRASHLSIDIKHASKRAALAEHKCMVMK